MTETATAASLRILRALEAGMPVSDCLLALLTRAAALDIAKPRLDGFAAMCRREPGRVLLQLLAWVGPTNLEPVHLALQLFAEPGQGAVDPHETAAATLLALGGSALDTRLRTMALQRIEASILAAETLGEAASMVTTVQRGLVGSAEATRNLSKRLLQWQQKFPPLSTSPKTPTIEPHPGDMRLVQLLSLAPPPPAPLPPQRLPGPATGATIIADSTPLNPAGGKALGVVSALFARDADGMFGWWARGHSGTNLVTSDLTCRSPWGSWQIDAEGRMNFPPLSAKDHVAFLIDGLVFDRCSIGTSPPGFRFNASVRAGGIGQRITGRGTSGVAGQSQHASGPRGMDGPAGSGGSRNPSPSRGSDGLDGGRGPHGENGQDGGYGHRVCVRAVEVTRPGQEPFFLVRAARFKAVSSTPLPPKASDLVEDRTFALGAGARLAIDVVGGDGGPGGQGGRGGDGGHGGPGGQGATGEPGRRGAQGARGLDCQNTYCYCNGGIGHSGSNGSSGGQGANGGDGGSGGSGGDGGRGGKGGSGGLVHFEVIGSVADVERFAQRVTVRDEPAPGGKGGDGGAGGNGGRRGAGGLPGVGGEGGPGGWGGPGGTRPSQYGQYGRETCSSGPHGLSGDRGMTGISGIEGHDGFTGNPGSRGEDGLSSGGPFIVYMQLLPKPGVDAIALVRGVDALSLCVHKENLISANVGAASEP